MIGFYIIIAYLFKSEIAFFLIVFVEFCMLFITLKRCFMLHVEINSSSYLSGSYYTVACIVKFLLIYYSLVNSIMVLFLVCAKFQILFTLTICLDKMYIIAVETYLTKVESGSELS